jgi:hypothetical protein
MEIMMARNMPISENLHTAFLSRDATEDFTIILARLAGLSNQPVSLEHLILGTS